jgi:hypothetical protein
VDGADLAAFDEGGIGDAALAEDLLRGFNGFGVPHPVHDLLGGHVDGAVDVAGGSPDAYRAAMRMAFYAMPGEALGLDFSERPLPAVQIDGLAGRACLGSGLGKGSWAEVRQIFNVHLVFVGRVRRSRNPPEHLSSNHPAAEPRDTFIHSKLRAGYACG